MEVGKKGKSLMDDHCPLQTGSFPLHLSVSFLYCNSLTLNAILRPGRANYRRCIPHIPLSKKLLQYILGHPWMMGYPHFVVVSGSTVCQIPSADFDRSAAPPVLSDMP